MSHLGDFFRKRRTEKGLSLGQIARLLGYTNVTKGSNRIQAFEAGRKVSPDLLSKLAEILEVGPDEIRRAAYEDYPEASDLGAKPATLLVDSTSFARPVRPVNREELTARLAALDPHRWRCARFRDVERDVRWLPVCDLLGHGFSVGLAHDGGWVLESVDGLVPCTSDDALDSLMTCLFFPRGEIEGKLRDRIGETGLPADLAASFPTGELVAHALRFSPFYANLALDWIESGSRRDIFSTLLADFACSEGSECPEGLKSRVYEILGEIRRGPTGEP